MRARAARRGVRASSSLLPEARRRRGRGRRRASASPTCSSSTRSRPRSTPSSPVRPGSVGQVRACTARLMRLAKDLGVTTLIVGHVTKDGAIAGPRVLEHMVDAVLYFEGDRDHAFRDRARGQEPLRLGRARSASSRWARTGSSAVGSPSAALLAERPDGRPGLGRHGDDRGLAPAARRDPGARDAELPADAAAPRDRHRAPARPAGARGARAPRGPALRRPGRLRVGGGRREGVRAGRRPAARARARLGASGRRRCPAGIGRVRRARARRARCGRSRTSRRGCEEAAQMGFAERASPAAGAACRSRPAIERAQRSRPSREAAALLVDERRSRRSPRPQRLVAPGHPAARGARRHRGRHGRRAARRRRRGRGRRARRRRVRRSTCRSRRRLCTSCARWTARSRSTPVRRGSCARTCTSCPTARSPTTETGIRHRTAEQLSRATDALVDRGLGAARHDHASTAAGQRRGSS